jgi:hypothetical protein
MDFEMGDQFGIAAKLTMEQNNHTDVDLGGLPDL